MTRARTGLSDEELATARAALTADRRPRVAVRAQQFGGATTGTIVAIGDPSLDGDEFISVKVKLDGITDVVRFGPAELTVPVRASRAAVAPQKASSPQPARARPVSSKAVPAKSVSPKAVPAKSVGPRAAPVEAAGPATPVPKVPGTVVPGTTVPAAATRPAATGRKPASRRAPSAVTFTISSSGTAWSVLAGRGGRSLVRSTPVPAGAVTAIAELLAAPALRDAVDEVNGSALREAEQRAEQLRTELAAVESLLQSHRRPG